jgi:hypothetical protein
MVAGLIALAILADVTLNSSMALLFLMRKLADFVEYLSFWRH